MNAVEFKNLVERYISEESTGEEMELLREALKEPEYAAQLDRIMDEQLAASEASASDYEEVTRHLKKIIEEKIAKESNETPIVRHIRVSRRWAAAAAIIIMMGAIAYFWITRDSSSKELVKVLPAVPNDIAPGQEGAILTLTDGTTVVLDSLGNGVVATQNGTKVMLSNGQLAYNTNGTAASMAYNTVTTPKGRQFRLLLQDGTKVWLNAASSVRYPTVFTGKERKVEVTGEVYFEVAKDEKKPFRVKVNNQTEIEVLGTHFNINSYQDEASVNTTLLEGMVRISNGGEKAILKPGQQAQVAAAPGIKIVSDVDMEKVMAWKNGVFNFQDATLKEVMRQLERWYDIDVAYEKGVPNLEFMGKMGRDLKLSEVLRGLEVSEVHFRIEGERKLVVMP